MNLPYFLKGGVGRKAISSRVGNYSKSRVLKERVETSDKIYGDRG